MSQQDPFAQIHGREISSEVLLKLEPGQLPELPIACKVCHQARWMATKKEIRCYCKMTFAYMWETGKPTEILDCDGLYEQEEDPAAGQPNEMGQVDYQTPEILDQNQPYMEESNELDEGLALP